MPSSSTAAANARGHSVNWDERRKLLELWNGASQSLPDVTFPGLFEGQVTYTPDSVALEFETISLSYRELNERANQLADFLIQRGIGPEDVVALLVPRSVEMIVGLLGILKAGAAYLPMDTGYPVDRLAFILEDASPACILASGEVAGSLPADPRILILDAPDTVAILSQHSAGNPLDSARTRPLLPDNAAYVIYTSGSTGRPKGVIVAHRELMNYLSWASRLYENYLGIGAPINTPLAFDATITSLYLPLMAGKKVILLAESRQMEELADLLASGAELTLVKMTPAHLQVLQGLLGDRASLIRARNFVVGGEALHESVAGFWRERVPTLRIVNEYGPTEAVVGCSVYELGPEADPSGMVPIGKPAPNTRLYVLDSDLQLVPSGVTGELHIGGSQLARGYLKRADLTADRFVADPYGSPGTRMYRTGDLARWRSDGNLEFLGRNDQQVKIRGHRVELGEIETALTQSLLVRAAAVTVRLTAAGHNHLVAHVVPTASGSPFTNELRDFLKQRLPSYMIPARFVVLDALPLTSNSKVDRQALSELLPPECDRLASYVPPRTEIESSVAEIFSQVLDRPRISMTENFFDLGGDSLASITLLSGIQARLGVRVHIADLLNAPTIEQLAQIIDDRSAFPGGSLVPFQRTGSSFPFFCIHGVGGSVIQFRELAKSLGPEQPFYGLQAAGVDDGHTPHIRAEDMARHYIEQIRLVQPQGPYHFGGWSFGGWVALEVGRQLTAAGEEVGLLALLDCHAPSSIGLHGVRDFLKTRSRFFLKHARTHLEYSRLHTSGRLGYLAEIVKSRLNTFAFEFKYKSEELSSGAIPKDYRNTSEAQNIAERRYRAKRYSGKVALFLTKSTCAEYPHDTTCGWGSLIGGGVEIHQIPGDHYTMMTEPHVSTLSEELRGSIPRHKAT